ncbi:MAG TPA: hypothetical protein VGI86_05650, partial [Acidimicrobiia bacterium]
IGYARSKRRAQKHGSDLLDFYRLVELYDRDGELAAALRAAPYGIGALVADVADQWIMRNPTAAANQMRAAANAFIDGEDVEYLVGAFVEALRS